MCKRENEWANEYAMRNSWCDADKHQTMKNSLVIINSSNEWKVKSLTKGKMYKILNSSQRTTRTLWADIIASNIIMSRGD